MDANIDPEFYNMANSNNNYQNQNIVQLQLDNSQELDDWRAEMLGLEWDNETDDYKEAKWKDPMCNKTGANAILSTLAPRSTKIFSLSNHGQLDIDRRCKQYIDDLTIFLVQHKTEFGIKSYAIMNIIIDTCDDIFRATVLKSKDGWEGEGIRGQTSSQEVKHRVEEFKQTEGGFNPLRMFKKRGG